LLSLGFQCNTGFWVDGAGWPGPVLDTELSLAVAVERQIFGLLPARVSIRQSCPPDGFIPVALYGATSLDVNQVVLSSLHFGGAVAVNAAGRIVKITSDEVDSGNPHDGPDMAITLPSSFGLRRERSGSGDGRVYTIWYTVTTSAGQTAATCRIQVPHDSSGK